MRDVVGNIIPKQFLSYQLYLITFYRNTNMKLKAINIILFKFVLSISSVHPKIVNELSFVDANAKDPSYDRPSRSDKVGAKIPLTSYGLKTPKFRSNNKSNARDRNISRNLPFLTVVDDSIVGLYFICWTMVKCHLLHFKMSLVYAPVLEDSLKIKTKQQKE